MIAGMFQHPFEAGRMLRGLLGPRDCAPLPRLGENGGFLFRQQHLIQEIQLRWDSPKMTSSHIFLLQRVSVYIATPWPCMGPVFPSNPLLADQGKEDAMPKSKWKVPSGWDEYSPIGEQVRGTPFICFKTPLQPSFGRYVTLNTIIMIENWKCLEMTYFWMYDRAWGIQELLDACPKLAMVIDTQVLHHLFISWTLDNKNHRSFLSLIMEMTLQNCCPWYQALLVRRSTEPWSCSWEAESAGRRQGRWWT